MLAISNKKYDQYGFVLATIFITTALVIAIVTYVIGTSITTHQIASKQNNTVNAQLAADAGLDYALVLLTKDSTYTGTAGEIQISNNGTTRSTYQVSIIAGSVATKKTVQSIGRTYQPVGSATPVSTRKYELDAEAVTSGNGPASVVTGVGGLILNNNSKISGGDVIVNGTILVNNNAQIGLSSNPLNVRVAHMSCPTTYDSTYPRVCASGENGQPITANGPIYADVKAQNQTTSTNMSLPGLTSDIFAPITVPGYDRTAHKAAVTATYASTVSPITCSGGTASWPANVKITDNASLPNNCTVTVNGNVWITGNLTMGNNVTIKVSNGLAGTRPVVMIDGVSGFVFGNNTTVAANTFNTGVEFITTWWNTNTATNGNFTCGGIADPLDCTNVTGLALQSSSIANTIDFSNNSNAPYSILRSLWSKTTISNNGSLGAVSGQTIQLGSNAVINFTTSIPGSSNLVSTWVKRGYIRVF